MQEVTIKLFSGEVNDIIKVLGQLPTESNAWPLVQKLKAQLEEQTKPAEVE